MLANLLRKTLEWINALATETGDGDELRLRKALLLGAVLAFTPAVIPWVVLYLAHDEPQAAVISLLYLVVSWSSAILYLRWRRFAPFLLSQQLLVLMLPFFYSVVLGGFANSSAAILWAAICPLGTIVIAGPKRAQHWLYAYLGLLILSGLLQPYLRARNNLPPRLVTLFFALNIASVVIFVFVLLFYFVREREKAYRLLGLEQEKSERLLLNVLPAEIAGVLKAGQRTIAEHYDSASILFADIVGFTPLSAILPPAESLEILNDIFSYFDDLVDKYGLEKIRTIGDSYMVAAGVPRSRPDHAQALAGLALEMGDYLVQRPSTNGQRIDFRMGMNSGPLVAGVIGRHKFHYDVWGDTVNTASRMESQGLPGKIQITAATRKLLQGEFACQYRGRIDVKGKGEMETWFLIGHK